MQFAGGKHHLGSRIASVIMSMLTPNHIYWEPFLGAGGVLRHVRHPLRIATDGNRYLAHMWEELLAGWEPPDTVSEQLYREARDLSNPMPDPLRAFVMFGCSWGGKWGGGYAHSKSRGTNYAGAARRSLLRKLPGIRGSIVYHSNYRALDIVGGGDVVYCDPPYADSINPYGPVDPFDHDEFWAWVDRLAHLGAGVLVSSVAGPVDIVTPLVEFDVGVSKGCTHKVSVEAVNREMVDDPIECSLLSPRERLLVPVRQYDHWHRAVRDLVPTLRATALL